MTREELAEALTMDMHGYDSDFGDDVFGADDPIKRGGLSTLVIQLSILNAQQLGNAATGVDLFSQADLDAAALPTGIASPVIATYKQLIKYLVSNPAMLQSVVFASSETSTGGAPVLQSLTLTPTRVTPWGLSALNSIPLQAYQTTQDFQANRSTVPLKAVIDGFTKLNLTSAVNGSGGTVTINCIFFFGKRHENRKMLKGGQPLTMRPGGRGPAPVGK